MRKKGMLLILLCGTMALASCGNMSGQGEAEEGTDISGQIGEMAMDEGDEAELNESGEVELAGVSAGEEEPKGQREDQSASLAQGVMMVQEEESKSADLDTLVPFTAPQLAQIAADLGIPDWLETEARQDEPYYWDAGERWLTAVSFFAGGEMVAGASVDSFTLEQCRNIWRYSGPESSESPDESDASDAVNSVVSVDFQRQYENGMERGVITGLDSQGNPVWVYETEAYGQTELDRVSEIGILDSRYYFVEGGTVKTLDLGDGTVCWENKEFGGASPAYVFGDEKELYLCGYYGPDFFAVDFMGNSLVRVEEFESGSAWPYEMEYDGDSVTVYMDQPVSEEIAGYRVSLEDLYSYEPVYR